MNALTILTEILTFLKVHGWAVSLNGVAKGPVTKATLHLNSLTEIDTHFEFTVDGANHVIDANRALVGGASTVTLDGNPFPNAHLALSTHVVGFPPHLKIELDVDLGNGTRYRFDGTVI